MLTAEDWIKAGFRALCSGGAQAIRVERLARDLKVSKGSFYWHFADAQALQAAMLRHWQHVATEHVIADLDASGADGLTRLRCLADFVSSPASDSYGGQATEPAIRDWARHDAATAAALARVDACRTAYLERLFADAGLADARLRQAVRLFYTLLIGAQHRGLPEGDLRADLEFVLTRC
jgi:AcrR family transcriptional regulator